METFPGARFCRRCGAPLTDPVGGDTGNVSPNAATVPLTNQDPRATDGLAPEEEPAHKETSRVTLAEMERLLRADDEAQAQADSAANHGKHPPATTRPDYEPADGDEELTITVPRAPQTRETGDFETTADFEATHIADFDATRPASSMPSRLRHVTYDAPAADLEDEAAEVEAPTSSGAQSDAAEAAHADDAESTDGAAAAGYQPAEADYQPADGARDAASSAGARGARPRRAWPLVVAVCAAVLAVAAVGTWLAFSLLRRPTLTNVNTQGTSSPTPPPDALQQFEAKLAEAEALLAGGDMQSALARLGEANELDPSNTRAHRRLAELLFASGKTREAIEEFRAVTRNAPEDSDAWNRLASLQVAEGLDRDAVESFRRFIALMGGEASVGPADLLAYARALLRSGGTEEARALFQRLASGPDAAAAAAARHELDELARAHPTPTPRAGEPTPTPRADEVASAATPAPPPPPTPTPPSPTPTPAPPAAGSPAERYDRGVQLWPSNRAAALEEFRAAAAGGNYDANYYLGLSYVEGRSAGSLKRAEVVAALRYFQLAQRGSQHASEARGHAQQLEKEFDRLRRQ